MVELPQIFELSQLVPGFSGHFNQLIKVINPPQMINFPSTFEHRTNYSDCTFGLVRTNSD